METSTLMSRIIRGCRPEEAEFVLALRRQAEATSDVSETAKCSLEEAKYNLEWSTVKWQESWILLLPMFPKVTNG